MINDGQTIVMGGLIESQQTHDERKMPVLGDLPIIGQIFKREIKQLNDRELMLFVTPHIIRDPSEATAVTIPDDRERWEDVKAPFWKVKRKPWYKKIVRDHAEGDIVMEIDGGQVQEDRETAMRDALKSVRN
jgi:type II secretory pathway component GspD/PulD (secretin)